MKLSFNKSKCAKAHGDPRLVAQSQTGCRLVYQKCGRRVLFNCVADYDDMVKKVTKAMQATART
jgi:hypothetical protein